MKNLTIIVLPVLTLLAFCMTARNPYDPDRADYVAPVFTIDSTGTTVWERCKLRRHRRRR